MNMISEQTARLRDASANAFTINSNVLSVLLREAASTIETLHAELKVANMELSKRYSGTEKELIEEMAEEIENCYGRETELTERARKYIRTNYP